MAVLGVGGRLKLRREAAQPCLINYASVSTTSDTIAGICPGYWNGDRITVDCLPVDDGRFPAKPDSYAVYFGSNWFLGPNRSQVQSQQDPFYKSASQDFPDGEFGDDSQFYARTGDVSGGQEIPECTPDDYYIHIDSLGNVSFYRDRCSALQGCKTKRIPLANVKNNFIIAHFGSIAYNNAIWQCIELVGEYQFSDGRDNVTLVSICDDPPEYVNPVPGTDEFDNADLEPRGPAQGQAFPYWQVMCEIREWSLNLDAPSVDTTSVGEKFGEAVKSIVTGGGSVDYLIEKKCRDDEFGDGTDLMKLLLMTDRGCQAEAQFFMLENEGEACNTACGLRSGSLFYQTEMLVTGTALNLRPTEVVAGTANFVTTGEIRLLEAP